jgi:hypothetical protein
MTPALALADLKKRAQATAEQIVAATVGSDGTAPALAFEVVGVLLTSGLLEDGYPGWCAYGTLQTAMPGGSVVP